MNTRERTIEDEIHDLTAEAQRLDWESRNPRACPRAAWSAEERLQVVKAKIAGLEARVTKEEP